MCSVLSHKKEGRRQQRSILFIKQQPYVHSPMCLVYIKNKILSTNEEENGGRNIHQGESASSALTTRDTGQAVPSSRETTDSCAMIPVSSYPDGGGESGLQPGSSTGPIPWGKWPWPAWTPVGPRVPEALSGTPVFVPLTTRVRQRLEPGASWMWEGQYGCQRHSGSASRAKEISSVSFVGPCTPPRMNWLRRPEDSEPGESREKLSVWRKERRSKRIGRFL